VAVLALSVVVQSLMVVPPAIDEVVPQIAPQADLDATLMLRAARRLADMQQAGASHRRH